MSSAVGYGRLPKNGEWFELRRDHQKTAGPFKLLSLPGKHSFRTVHILFQPSVGVYYIAAVREKALVHPMFTSKHQDYEESIPNPVWIDCKVCVLPPERVCRITSLSQEILKQREQQVIQTLKAQITEEKPSI